MASSLCWRLLQNLMDLCQTKGMKARLQRNSSWERYLLPSRLTLLTSPVFTLFLLTAFNFVDFSCCWRYTEIQKIIYNGKIGLLWIFFFLCFRQYVQPGLLQAVCAEPCQHLGSYTIWTALFLALCFMYAVWSLISPKDPPLALWGVTSTENSVLLCEQANFILPHPLSLPLGLELGLVAVLPVLGACLQLSMEMGTMV